MRIVTISNVNGSATACDEHYEAEGSTLYDAHSGLLSGLEALIDRAVARDEARAYEAAVGRRTALRALDDLTRAKRKAVTHEKQY